MIALESLTLRSVLKQSTRRFRERIAFSAVDGDSILYGQLAERVEELSRLLHERGIIAGDRVAILSENKPNWGVAYFAVTTMGAVAVPILPDFHPNEVQHILRHSESKALFVSRKLLGALEEKEFTHLTTRILIDDMSLIPPEESPDRIRQIIDQGSREISRLKEVALRVTGKIAAEVREDDIASIIYTSGTTGHSKGVMLTHKNLVADTLATSELVDVNEEDRFLSILPLSHSYECTLGMIAPVMLGASVYYLDKPPSAGVLMPAMAKVRPTVMLSVPLVIEKIFKGRIHPKLTGNPVVRGLYRIPLFRRRLHAAAGKKLLASFGGKLRIFTIGGAPLAPEVELFLREAGFPYAIGYGLTETSPLVAGSAPQSTKFRSTGFPVSGARIKIDSPDPATGEGEILVKGPMVMKGYYKDPKRTAEVMMPDGWFRTGDLGVFDGHGYLYIKGRLKNLILGPSGKNIYPEEIESTINEFDIVVESLVFQEDNQLAARVHLNYEELDKIFSRVQLTESQIREKMRSLLDDLRRQINGKLSSFSRLQRLIEQREPFEKTPTQKIKRHLYV
ncbi:MAG TPA: AMP-binding protein [Bacteroidota bacterium]|nr:AMP-binding protein [Bacteroidota bacterium]